MDGDSSETGRVACVVVCAVCVVVALVWLVGSDAMVTPVRNVLAVLVLAVAPCVCCCVLAGDDDA
jgi:hypothetical protein